MPSKPPSKRSPNGGARANAALRPTVIGAVAIVAGGLLSAMGTVIAGVLDRPPPASPPVQPAEPAEPVQSVPSAPPAAKAPIRLSIEAPAGLIPRCHLIRISGTVPAGSVVWLASRPADAPQYFLREMHSVPGDPHHWQLQADIQNTQGGRQEHVFQAIALSRKRSLAFRGELNKWVNTLPGPAVATSTQVSMRRDPARDRACP